MFLLCDCLNLETSLCITPPSSSSKIVAHTPPQLDPHMNHSMRHYPSNHCHTISTLYLNPTTLTTHNTTYTPLSPRPYHLCVQTPMHQSRPMDLDLHHHVQTTQHKYDSIEHAQRNHTSHALFFSHPNIATKVCLSIYQYICVYVNFTWSFYSHQIKT